MTLLFIHGSGFTGNVFSQQLAVFPGSFAPNLPGHDAPASAGTVGEFGDFIELFIKQHDLHDVTLCGNSLGGAIALDVALRENPALRSMVLLGSGARLRVAPRILEGLGTEFERTCTELAQMLYADPTPERVAYAVEAMHHVGQAQTLADYEACNEFDVMDRLGELALPVLALTGEADQMTPPKYAEVLAGRVQAGKARIIQGAGHLVMAERPEETNAAIAEFLS